MILCNLRFIMPTVVGVALLNSFASGQAVLRLLENPVQGADAQFGATGAPREQFLFVMSAATGPANQLSFFDPLDLRVLGFDYTQVTFASEGAFDASGRAVIHVPAGYLATYASRPFYAQFVTFPGIATVIDDLSNVVSQRVGTGIGGISGTVLDETNRPLVGAVVTLVGNSQRQVTTDQSGQFVLRPVPPGRRHVEVDARRVPAPTPYFYSRMDVVVDVQDGPTTPVGFTVYIPKASGGQVLRGTTASQVVVQNTVAGSGGGTLEIEIPVNTRLDYPPGTNLDERLTIIRVDATRTPMAPSELQRPKWDFAIYPPGVQFVNNTTGAPQPARVTFVTDEAMTPGKRWVLKRPNHETHLPEYAGEMVASAGPNGTTILTTVSGGATGGGWHYPSCDPTNVGRDCNPPTKGCAVDLGANCQVDFLSGSLHGMVRTPPVLVGGADMGLQFVYESQRAQPYARFLMRANLNTTFEVPRLMALEGSVGGVPITPRYFDTSGFGSGGNVLISGSVALPTSASGSEPVDIRMMAYHRDSSFGVPVVQAETIDSCVDSPFGCGWTLDGLDRILSASPTRILLSHGSGPFQYYSIGGGVADWLGGTGPGAGGDGGRPLLAQVRWPQDLAADPDGSVYFVDAGNHTVRAVGTDGVVRRVAGTPGSFGSGGDDGPATQCYFDFRQAAGVFAGGVAVDSSASRRRIYIADYNNHRVRYVDLDTGRIHAFAGSGQGGHSGDGSAARLAQLRHPTAVAVDGLGRVWIADTGNHCIRMVVPDGSRILTVAGYPLQPGYSGDGGLAWLARMNQPTGLAIDSFGTVYVADRGNHMVRRITPNGRIERFLGTGVPASFGTLQVSRLSATIAGPADVAVDPQGTVYVVGADAGEVVVVTPDDRAALVHPIQGAPAPVGPSAIAITADGLVVFSEPSAHRIRRIEARGFYPEARPHSEVIRRLGDGRYVHTRADQSRAVFDALGRVTQLVVPEGLVRQFLYQGTSQLLTRVVLENGQAFDLQYDQNGKLSQVTDPAGRVCRTTMRNGNLVRWDAPGPDAATRAVTTFSYESNDVGHLLESMTSPGNGSTTTFVRNAAGQYVSATQRGNGLGNGRTWGVSPFGSGSLPSQGTPPGTRENPLTAVSPSNLATWTNPRGFTHVFELHPQNGWVMAHTEPPTAAAPAGARTEYSRDANGLVTQIRRPGPGNPVTNITYDAMGRTTRVELPPSGAGRIWNYEYGTLFPTPTRVIDPRGNATTVELDPLHGRPVVVTDPMGLWTRYDYDARGRVVLVRQPYENGQRSVALNYDAQDRVITVTDPLGGTLTYNYYSTGAVHEAGDQMQSRTAYTYTPAGDVASVTTPLGNTTRFEYDVMGSLVRLTDSKTSPGPGVNEFGYDGAGRRIWRRDPMQNVEVFALDEADNIVAWTSREQETITYAYDSLDRLLRKAHGSALLGTYQYDQRGNLTRADNASARLGCSYDAADRLMSEDTTGSPHQPPGIVAYQYDTSDNLVSISALGYAVTRVCDSRGHMVASHDSLGASIAWTRDLLGRRVGAVRSNGVSTEWRWDRMDRLALLRHLAPGGTSELASWFATRDAVGNPTRVSENRGGSFPGGIAAYYYDLEHRLVREERPNPSFGRLDYAYDQVGNRLYGGSANVDNGNRLLSDLRRTFSYDRRGNLTSQVNVASGATRHFMFDVEGQLVEVRDYRGGPHGSPDSAYCSWFDALGRRVRRQITANGGVISDNRYVMANQDVIVMRSEVAATSYGFMQFDVLDEVLASSALGSADHSWYLCSEGGTVENTTGSNGLPRLSRSTTTFGVSVVVGEDPLRPDEAVYAFAGRESEPFGMQYHRARTYVSESGRFLGEDRIGDALLQSFDYAKGNPLRFADIDGQSAEDIERIRREYDSAVTWMTTKGYRLSSNQGRDWDRLIQNNLGGYWGCNAQSLLVQTWLNTKKYDDNWTFEIENLIWHRRVRARSSNPDDPELVLDPWKGTFGR